MNDIFSLTPINKKASIVTSQRGCSNSFIDEEQGLIDALKSIEKQILSSRKGGEKRKLLGIKKQKLSAKLSRIRDEKGFNRKDLEKFSLVAFKAAAKRHLPEYKYKSLLLAAEEIVRNKTNPSQ